MAEVKPDIVSSNVAGSGKIAVESKATSSQ
jgi:hypothetical protein